MSAFVAVATFSPEFGNLEANNRRVLELIRDALTANVNIIVLPELCLSGYMFDTIHEVKASTIPLQSPYLRQWSEALQGTDSVVVGCVGEAAEDGNFYITAVILDAHGIIGVYRKTHLWNNENRFFTRGDAMPPVVETKWGRISPLVCYDLEFPEFIRAVSSYGADLIVTPTNWSASLSGDHDEPRQLTMARVMAMQARVFIACCDRVGEEKGQAFASGSGIIDPDGNVLVRQGVEGVGAALVDLPTARNRDLSAFNHTIRDRRPELYTFAEIVEEQIEEPLPAAETYTPAEASETERF